MTTQNGAESSNGGKHANGNGSAVHASSQSERNGISRIKTNKKPRLYTILKIVMALLVVLLACLVKAVWDSDVYEQFFTRKSEYMFLRSMNRVTKWILLKCPFLAEDVKRNLAFDSKGHQVTWAWYDPAQHDRVHRALITNLLSLNECARLRSLLLRNSLRQGVMLEEGNDDVSLDMEFQAMSLFHLLGVYQDGTEVRIQPEEVHLLKSVLERVQRAAETKFDNPNLVLEYSDITVRRNPSKDWIHNLHYLTTGGHPLHSDQCSTIDTPENYHYGFECTLHQFHCCAHRTHSVLLYLNDPHDNSLKGGDLYLANRHDLLEEDEPSYSGLGFAKQLQDTVRVKPTCGNLMLFTSDARNLHGTFPIQRGSRFAMPMWFTSPTNLPWHGEEILIEQMNDMFWPALREKCEVMGSVLPVPSGLQPYLSDCEGMEERVKELAGWNEE